MSIDLSRRSLLRAGGLLGVQAVAGSSLFALGCDLSFFGPLGPPDANGIRLPQGFRSRVLARSGDPVADTGHVWHGAPDGGAVFEVEDGWIYVSNAERFFTGGVGALRFDRDGRVRDAYAICSGTRRNCAGGATPWGTWLTCEEVGTGLVWECDPEGSHAPAARPALGRFNHEAVAVDAEGRLYLTEDRTDGRLYRFRPDVPGDLRSGRLEVAEVVVDGHVRWLPVPDPDPAPGALPTRRQVPASTAFRGGEGIVFADEQVYFVTKGDDRVWGLDLGDDRLRIVYDRASDPLAQLSGVDNVTVAPGGDLVVAEDGGNMELVMLTPEGVGLPLLRVVGQDGSELTGPAFDPRGRRLYFSSQRGTDGRGITYEVSGPFLSMRRNAFRRFPRASRS